MVEDTSVLCDEHQLGGGGACVDTEIGVTLVGAYIRIAQVKLLVAVDELVILGVGAEKGLARNYGVGSPCGAYLLDNIAYMERLLGSSRLDSTAVSHENRSLGREHSVLIVKTESPYKSLFESAEKE